MTRRYSAVIYINFTVLAAESSLTDAPVAVDVIEARAAVETRWLKTLIYLQLTVISCIQSGPESDTPVLILR